MEAFRLLLASHFLKIDVACIGAKVDSSEFPGRRMRMSEMVNEYKQRVQSCVSVDDAVTTLRQLVFDWRFNHRGINAQR